MSRGAGAAGLLRAARGIVLVIHLFPALMNGVAGAVFYLIAAQAFAIGPALMLGLSVFLIHASIGSLNDYLDIDLDRRSRPEKPLVRGDLSSGFAFAVSIVSAVGGLLLSLVFGLPVMLLALVVLAAGLAYDLWLKGTVWSWAPYGIAIPALPVWGFLAAGQFAPVLLVSFPLGVLVALALNLANTIPDIRDDTAYGIQGLAHRLGVRNASIVTWLCFAITIVLLALTPVFLGNDPKVLLPLIGLGAVVLAVMVGDRLVNRSLASLRRGWYLSAVLAGILGIAWVASLPLN